MLSTKEVASLKRLQRVAESDEELNQLCELLLRKGCAPTSADAITYAIYRPDTNMYWYTSPGTMHAAGWAQTPRAYKSDWEATIVAKSLMRTLKQAASRPLQGQHAKAPPIIQVVRMIQIRGNTTLTLSIEEPQTSALVEAAEAKRKKQKQDKEDREKNEGSNGRGKSIS